jgi:myosin heavy subunit
MAAATRNVHWENEASELSFASPLRDVSAQSIQYVNAQLVAHGFTHGSGIRLDALSSKDQQAALKCLVNMLGQRVVRHFLRCPVTPHVAVHFSTPRSPDMSPQVDMARTEELTTKYKTLAYDHERLVAQHTLALTTAATAERDVETAKARMDSMLKRLGTEEEAHRKSRDEFQKVKSSMQYLRQTTANELKRKEKEVEKMVERLGKMSNDQIKLGTVGAGLACTNLLPDNPLPQVRT